MNKKLIKNTILFAGIAGALTTVYMINVEAKNNPTSINRYNTKSQIVDIPDTNFKKGINKTLGRGEVLDDISVADMESLETLTINNKYISNIEGVQYAINLTSLNLSYNSISDISLLRNLISLTELKLSFNNINEVSSIKKLNNLTTLSLTCNQISDISPLENLNNLTILYLYGNKISNISFLENLTNLDTLNIGGHQLSDISPLRNLTNLTTLGIHDNKVSDISYLANLTNLTTLEMHNNQISNISSLENLTSLTSLSLYKNQILDISVLGNLSSLASLTSLDLSNNKILEISGLDSLTNLTSLNLSNNQISKISGLDGLTNLTSLNLSNNQISKISGLENLGKLTSLYLQNNQIIEIGGLESLNKLNKLEISSNKISDISSLSNLTSLQYVRIVDNLVSNISPLSNLKKLQFFWAGNNLISDISPLSTLSNLNEVGVSKNQVTDISSLESLTKLTNLQLHDNQISDISVLKNLTKLTNLQLHNNQIFDISPLSNLTKLTTLNLVGQKMVTEHEFKINTGLINISVNNLIKGINGENIGITSISNSGRYENGKLFWDNVTLGKKTFTSNFSQAIQINTAKTTFSGTVAYNIDIVDGEGPIVDNDISINEEDFALSATITAEDLLSEVDYLIHKGERHDLPYTFNYDVFNRENNIVEVYDTAGNITEYEVTADLLDLKTVNSLISLLKDNDNSPEVIAYIRAIINNMSESTNKDLLNDKINNLSFDMTLDRLTTSVNVDIYIKCENLLSMTLDTNMITFENYSSAEDMEKSNAIAITVNSSLPYQLNAYLPTEIQNADGTKTLDKSIFNIKESSEDEYKKFTSIGRKVVLKDSCKKGNDLTHLIDLKLSSNDAHDADIYKTVLKFEIEQK